MLYFDVWNTVKFHVYLKYFILCEFKSFIC